MKKVLIISPTYGNIKLADATQNKRLFSSLSNLYDLTIITKHKVFEDDKLIICLDAINLNFFDRILWKIFPSLIQVFSFTEAIWLLKCYKYLIKNHDYNYLLCTYQPNYAFILVPKIRKYFSKIISLFYDPCAPNLFLSQSNLALKLRSNIEKRIASFSDIMALNNEMYFKYCYEKYSHMTSVVSLPMCIPDNKDENKYNNNESSIHKDGKVHIVFAGNIYGKRKLDPLIETISNLNEGLNLKNLLSIDFYGSCVKEEKNKVIKSKAFNIINFYSYLSYEELIIKYQAANAFLLIEPIEGNNYSFPSKVLEYISYDKPIFIYASKNNAVRQLSCEEYIYIADNNSLITIESGIRKLILCSDEIKIKRNIEKFLPINVAEKLFSFIENN